MCRTQTLSDCTDIEAMCKRVMAPIVLSGTELGHLYKPAALHLLFVKKNEFHSCYRNLLKWYFQHAAWRHMKATVQWKRDVHCTHFVSGVKGANSIVY